jgi:hypothetical protein
MAYNMQYNITIDVSNETGFRLTYLSQHASGRLGYNCNSPIPDARPFVDRGRTESAGCSFYHHRHESSVQRVDHGGYTPDGGLYLQSSGRGLATSMI